MGPLKLLRVGLKALKGATPPAGRDLYRTLRDTVLTLRSVALTPVKIRRLLNGQSHVKLHLGCGLRILDGWVNSDSRIRRTGEILYINLLKRIPFPDASVEFVFSEHVHEHLSYEDGLRLLREVYRIISPSGVLRLALPDLALIIRLYTDPKQHADFIEQWHRCIMPDMPASSVGMMNWFFMDHGHQYLYDFESLKHQLLDAGFKKISQFEPGKSEWPELANLESNPLKRGETLDIHLAYTLCVEAKK